MVRDSFVRAALCAATVAVCGGIAAAGPDVIVGEIYGVSNYASGVFSIGTRSCNVGDTPLAWVANTSQHPVISQNMYRLHQGRFTQLGQAWLKHGFCALQGNFCSPCTPGGNCSALFPGCSDPYDSGLNGQQSGLGPKSEVNAFNGVFPYPWVNNGSGSGAAFKRLAVDPALLGVAGAQYFVSSMYVQPQDASSGNGLNSQSYRACSTTATTITYAALTQQMKPALQAWKDADATVQISNFDVPVEGRFIVAMKPTSLGGGNWRYEYAIQNFNSDRSGQGFVVPIPMGTVVSNLGFADVAYHSGEPYSGTDWSASVSGSQITWTTQTHAANANANALRWDTIYNFWFDANVAPGQGSATINLFKPGSPASVSGGIQVPGGAGGPVGPANDLCVNAASLSGYGSFPFNTTSAATDGPSETLCTGSGSSQVYNDVWFTYTACTSGTHTVSTCGSNFDSRIAVYGAACPGGTANTAIACNDDSAVCGTGSLQSNLTFSATSGQTYRIRLGSYYNNMIQGQGYGQGNLVLSGPACGLLGDACAGPIALTGYGATAFTTVGATTDGTAPSSCGTGGQIGNDIWFTYTACVSGSHTVDTCAGGNYDSTLVLYTGACGALTQAGCNDDTTGCGAGSLSSRIIWTATAGTQYRIRLGGYQGATGSGTLTLSGPVCTPPGPDNDNCAAATVISGYGSTAFTNVGATTDGPAEALCNAFGSNQVGADVWYRWTGCASGTITISVCDASYDTRLAVYGGNCPASGGVILVCNDDACGTNGLRSQVTFAAVASTTYLIRIGGFNSATGSGTLAISGPACPPPGPANDNCANREGVGQGNTVFSTIGATTDGPAHAGCLGFGDSQVANDIWYNHPSQCPGSIRIALCDANYDTKLAAYLGSGCTDYEARLMACNDDACGGSGLASAVRIQSRIGENYTIRIGGFGGATGSGNMTIVYCPADFDGSGSVDVPDIFAFLSAWFAQDIRADLDGAPGVGVPDIFAFLSLWFAGAGACG